MIVVDGIKYFGIFDDEKANCHTDDYPPIDPAIKGHIVKHIEGLSPALTSDIVIDVYTGEEIPEDVVDAGMYTDMGYSYPTEVLYYIKQYDMGIPQEYIKAIMGN